MTDYTPAIMIKIPSDINHDRHSAIIETISAINERLAKQSKNNREAAIDTAATALSTSGVGACGIASCL